MHVYLLSYRFFSDNSAVVTRASNVLTLAQWNLAKFQSEGPVGTGLCLKVTLQCWTRQSLVNTSQTWYQSCCNFASVHVYLLSYRFFSDNSAVVTRASNVLTLAQWNLAKFQSEGPVGTGLCLKVTLQCWTRQSLVNTSQTWYQVC